MRLYHFRRGYKNGREFGVMIGRWQLRLARYQFAFWFRERPVFNFLF